MGVDLKTDSQLVQFPLSLDPQLYLDHIQTWVGAGKTLEMLSTTQLQQAISGSYKHALIAFEEVDRVIRLSYRQKNNDHEGSELVFPFDVINRTNNTLFDTWRVMMGIGTKAEEDLVERLDAEIQKQHANDAFYSDKIAALEAAARENEKRLAIQNSVCDKAIKEKQAAQRSVRKQKADLDKKTKKTALLVSELEQQKKQVELLQVQQEELIAEKDGLHQHVEVLQQQLKQLSN
ncbi:hypothetical protein [Photobacterium lipolyticum]|uniref:Uncharacterized protein n=1 Tax=Photobacterium lipolyticum TaxID=266810 RepID=A0A2T3MZ60_9GAMM|nr:hypothetical protein [Photobacterium lipolyticum]PSW05244.1 hypothetical protein C9I89_10730 [Photobacterium lipolyticum]